ncbi:Fructose-bisphosphate aldolase class-I family protein [Leishmania donovani]|uniref:fructose-bisphosphate aldolase n=1 Tax=Leishmania donovani TaxID=5661 RepID=A0A504XUR5_LEIDO|nr:Fructose-bisphosphate aldolase class-I family protein [Leishmania donovani]
MSATTKVLWSKLPAHGRMCRGYEKKLLETVLILGADEPNNTLEKCRKFRVILLATEDLSKNVGGMILSKESAEKNCLSGTMFTEMLPNNRIVSGMNVDGKLHSFYEAWGGYVEGVRYAALSPLNGLVPIVEPEVMEVTHGVVLKGMLLKPSTVVAGLHELQSSGYLRAINSTPVPRPWDLAFAFGCALLRGSAVRTWKGKNELIPETRRASLHGAKVSSLAASGTYDAELETSV